MPKAIRSLAVPGSGLILTHIRRQWFLAGLVAVFAVTVGDTSGTIALAGQWLKAHYGPNIIIFVIFLFSGLLLDADQIRSGLTDIGGTGLALAIIFIVAPILVILPGLMPLDIGVKIGLFLVAAMPTTLSSGVVMTGKAGGNMAQALVITVIANSLSVFTIPFTLALLLPLAGESAREIHIDQAGIIIRLTLLVLLPLVMGLAYRYSGRFRCEGTGPRLQNTNQMLILVIVWMAVSQARDVITAHGDQIGTIGLFTVFYHGLLLGAAVLMVRLFRVGRGRMESILFMGGQKTLALSIILQVTVFPQYGMALVVCVLHHIIHLMMDSYLAARLGNCGEEV